jgi:hypothetical protein
MTAKDYIDTKGYKISPNRSVRRTSGEGGEQQILPRRRESDRKLKGIEPAMR